MSQQRVISTTLGFKDMAHWKSTQGNVDYGTLITKKAHGMSYQATEEIARIQEDGSIEVKLTWNGKTRVCISSIQKLCHRLQIKLIYPSPSIPYACKEETVKKPQFETPPSKKLQKDVGSHQIHPAPKEETVNQKSQFLMPPPPLPSEKLKKKKKNCHGVHLARKEKTVPPNDQVEVQQYGMPPSEKNDNKENSHRVHLAQDTEHSEQQLLDSLLDDDSSSEENTDGRQKHEEILQLKKEYVCQGPKTERKNPCIKKSRVIAKKKRHKIDVEKRMNILVQGLELLVNMLKNQASTQILTCAKGFFPSEEHNNGSSRKTGSSSDLATLRAKRRYSRSSKKNIVIQVE